MSTMIQLLDFTDNKSLCGTVSITGSKSESNRLLILQNLYPNLQVENLSNSDDTKVLQKALTSLNNEVNIGHAGTAMRFLTALFAIKEGETKLLTGSERMQNRPIGVLVAALQDLGAEIRYEEKIGFPPLQIEGRKLTKNQVKIAGNISSQYITALLLIAPSLPKGLEIELVGEVTSVPYINMTLGLLQQLGMQTNFEGQKIRVNPQETIETQQIHVESDWSSASYYFSLVALHTNAEVLLKGFTKQSLQGDRALVEIYSKLGVKTLFEKEGIRLISTDFDIKELQLDLTKTPDIAQTIAVTCLGLGIACHLTGLHTLKIKETDRLLALKTEMEKLGAKVLVTASSLQLRPPTKLKEHISITTYEDHRMAMAFAPLSVRVPIQIENAEVVSKSYPDFWKDWSFD